MPRYNIRVWYTVPRWKEVQVEADSPASARRIGHRMLESEDTNSWQEWDDCETEIDVEEVAS